MAARAGYNIGILGATGTVGRLLLQILAEHNFPVADLRLFASERSQGKKLTFRGREYTVEAAREDSFGGLDLLFASAATSANKHFTPIATQTGVTVIDDSSAFRMDPDVPLVIPEVNGEDLANHKGIIAGPNCSTIQLVYAITPIHRVNPIQRIVVDTYQAVSGWGWEAVVELEEQIRAVAAKSPQVPRKVFRHQILGNVLPEIDKFLEDGYTKEEWKVIHETRKILHEPDLPISCTAVRVPVFIGHSEAVHLELAHPMTAEEVRQVLRAAPGIRVMDEPAQGLYPVATDAAGTDDVLVGRIRRDASHPRGIALWIVADNLRIGAATNAVRIAETLLARNWLKPGVAAR